LLWTIARLAVGKGTMLDLWRGMAFALTPIALGAFGFIGVWVGAALAIPFLVRAVAETQKVRTPMAIIAVSVPVDPLLTIPGPRQADATRGARLQVIARPTRLRCLRSFARACVRSAPQTLHLGGDQRLALDHLPRALSRVLERAR
jgi:hypothetical protein